MRRGAYVARLDLEDPHLAGVVRKIGAQRAALARAGLPTALHALQAGAIMCDNTVLRPAGAGPVARRAAHYRHFWKDTLAGLEAADFLYARFQGAGPGFLNMLARYRARRPDAPILLEIPTYPYRSERRGPRQHLLGTVDDLGTPLLRCYVDRIVTFSGREEIMNIATIRTQNGVDVDALPMATPPLPNSPLRLVGVANFGIRHAYDRVIAGLAAYAETTGRRDVLFDLIGTGSLEPELRRLTEQLGACDLVRFVGPLSGEELDRAFDGAHAGISALGMHRIAAETSDLKSREYCARGLPFVTSNQDADFPRDMPYVWHLPADDSPVDVGALRAWCDRISADRRSTQAALRTHAETVLTWDAKMAPIVEWLRTRMAA